MCHHCFEMGGDALRDPKTRGFAELRKFFRKGTDPKRIVFIQILEEIDGNGWTLRDG